MRVINGRVCKAEAGAKSPASVPPKADHSYIADLGKERDFLFGKTELIGYQYPVPGSFIGIQKAAINAA
jgi:hypothetical protein